MVRLPDQDAFQQAWRSMAWGRRREFVRAINQGKAMHKRKDARIAVLAARQQQRYWKLAWLFGPVASLFLVPDWLAVAINALLLGAATGAYAFFRHRRAIQAEAANLKRLER